MKQKLWVFKSAEENVRIYEEATD